jgi:hypothetical protein
MAAHGFTHFLVRKDDLLVHREIGRAHSLGALEHHMLKKMGDTGHPLAFVGTARAGYPTGGDGRFIVPLHQQQSQTVGKVRFHDWHTLCL